MLCVVSVNVPSAYETPTGVPIYLHGNLWVPDRRRHTYRIKRSEEIRFYSRRRSGTLYSHNSYIHSFKTQIERVIFVVWSNKDRDVYRELLPEYFAQPEPETPESDPTEDKKSEEETPVERSA